ncbi:AP4AT protein, partial [Polypterus senegalus]
MSQEEQEPQKEKKSAEQQGAEGEDLHEVQQTGGADALVEVQHDDQHHESHKLEHQHNPSLPQDESKLLAPVPHDPEAENKKPVVVKKEDEDHVAKHVNDVVLLVPKVQEETVNEEVRSKIDLLKQKDPAKEREQVQSKPPQAEPLPVELNLNLKEEQAQKDGQNSIVIKAEKSPIDHGEVGARGVPLGKKVQDPLLKHSKSFEADKEIIGLDGDHAKHLKNAIDEGEKEAAAAVVAPVVDLKPQAKVHMQNSDTAVNDPVQKAEDPVLKILLHLCSHGSPRFLSDLRRNATFIQEVTGMGSSSGLNSGMQGFGYSAEMSKGASFLNRIQKAAEVVAVAVLPPPEEPTISPYDNSYQPVMAPSNVREATTLPVNAPPPFHFEKVHRLPGQAGGGWEENDSGHSSQNSSQENGDLGRASLHGSSKSGTDSQSAGSRESSDLSERGEAMPLSDCAQEMQLVATTTRGSKVFLTREETQVFLKECAILNCEVVVDLLSQKLQDPTDSVKMRALSALACLMSSDLLSIDQIFGITRQQLKQLSKGAMGPAGHRATKLLKQFEALMGQSAALMGQSAGLRPDCDVHTAQHAEGSPKLKTSASLQLPKHIPSGPSCPLSHLNSKPTDRHAAGPIDETRNSEVHLGLHTQMSRPMTDRGAHSQPQQPGTLAKEFEMAAVPSSECSLFSGMDIFTQEKLLTAPAIEAADATLETGENDCSKDSALKSVFSFLNL